MGEETIETQTLGVDQGQRVFKFTISWRKFI